MTKIAIHPITALEQNPSRSEHNPLPRLLQTPSGLALLELQGTINLPSQDTEDVEAEGEEGLNSYETPIGRLIFPDYDPEDKESTAWMKRVYLYVGKHQRLTGEVKKLPKAFAVIRKRRAEAPQPDVMETSEGDKAEELEVVEIIKWKILFSTRPEPVGTWTGEA